MNQKLIQAIFRSAWMIEPSSLNAILPSVLRAVSGENIKFYDKDISEFAPLSYYDEETGNEVTPEEKEEAMYVAVHRQIGVVTKYDQFCGPRGTVTLMRQMREADADDQVVAHFLEIDSGGGEATNIETTSRFIKSLNKPVIAWFNGLAASAAYYMAAAADEIYASEPTDIAGSIGTMVSFLDLKPWFEAQGIKVHEIYADQSKLKNFEFKQALDAKYGPIQKNFLNPYAQTFIDTIKEFRPGISDEDAFKGKTYMSDEAIRIGLIDGMLTQEEAVERAFELGRAHKANQLSNSNNAEMKIQTRFTALLALLGFATFESKDDHVSLSLDDMDKIEAELRKGQDEEEEQQKAQNELTDSLQQINETLQEIKAQSDANAQSIEALKKGPSAGPTRIPKEKESDQPPSAEEQRLAAYQAETEKVAENGSQANFQ